MLLTRTWRSIKIGNPPLSPKVSTIDVPYSKKPVKPGVCGGNPVKEEATERTRAIPLA